MSLSKKLKQISENAKANLKVGFFADSIYPDTDEQPGDYVANVAFKNNYGSITNPPRPFFSMAIEHNKSGYGRKLAEFYNASHDFNLAMGQLGGTIKNDVKLSIIDYTGAFPNNSAATIARKGFDKPLTDTGIMADSVTYQVSGAFSE